MQKLICGPMQFARQEINEYLEQGWKVVPGSLCVYNTVRRSHPMEVSNNNEVPEPVLTALLEELENWLETGDVIHKLDYRKDRENKIVASCSCGWMSHGVDSRAHAANIWQNHVLRITGRMEEK